MGAWEAFLMPLLGNSQEKFNAPNLAALRTSITLTKLEMHKLLKYMRNHRLAGEIRHIPLVLLDTADPETRTLCPFIQYYPRPPESNL